MDVLSVCSTQLKRCFVVILSAMQCTRSFYAGVMPSHYSGFSVWFLFLPHIGIII